MLSQLQNYLHYLSSSASHLEVSRTLDLEGLVSIPQRNVVKFPFLTGKGEGCTCLVSRGTGLHE